MLLYLPTYSPDLNPIEESFSTCAHISMYIVLSAHFVAGKAYIIATVPSFEQQRTLSEYYLSLVDALQLRWQRAGFVTLDILYNTVSSKK